MPIIQMEYYGSSYLCSFFSNTKESHRNCVGLETGAQTAAVRLQQAKAYNRNTNANLKKRKSNTINWFKNDYQQLVGSPKIHDFLSETFS